MTTSPPTDTAILAFEQRRYRHAGAKEAAARDELGFANLTLYAQALLRVAMNPSIEAALAHPDVIRMVRARVESRPTHRRVA